MGYYDEDRNFSDVTGTAAINLDTVVEVCEQLRNEQEAIAVTNDNKKPDVISQQEAVRIVAEEFLDIVKHVYIEKENVFIEPEENKAYVSIDAEMAEVDNFSEKVINFHKNYKDALVYFHANRYGGNRYDEDMFGMDATRGDKSLKKAKTITTWEEVQ